jgi:hypothetical protein
MIITPSPRREASPLGQVPKFPGQAKSLTEQHRHLSYLTRHSD